jgi:predicted nucleic acid-binding protein
VEKVSIFLDTGFFLAYYDSRDKYHKRALELVKKIFSGEFGTVFTSEYIFDETTTLTLARKGPAKAIELGEAILNSEIEIASILKEAFDRAWNLFKQRKNLSFTDCTTLEAMKANGIKNLASFDKGFSQFKKEISILG